MSLHTRVYLLYVDIAFMDKETKANHLYSFLSSFRAEDRPTFAELTSIMKELLTYMQQDMPAVTPPAPPTRPQRPGRPNPTPRQAPGVPGK